MLAVFQRLELSVLEQLLGAAIGESSFQLAAFTNQPRGSGDSVPDALMSGRFDLWFETKTEQNQLKIEQIREHYKNLTPDLEAVHERLFIVTPDPGPERPTVLAEFDKDPRVAWFSFRTLSDAIDQVLTDDGSVMGDRQSFVGEHSRFLLRELQSMFAADGLLDHLDTVIVAARFAWNEYLETGAYICQPDRSFRTGLRYMGFYTNMEIKPIVARVLYQEPQPIMFDDPTIAQFRKGEGVWDQLIGDTIEKLIAHGKPSGQPYRVFLLSHRDAEDSLHLPGPIKNTIKTSSGRGVAWTMGQRYTRSAALTAQGVSTTTELEASGG